MKTIVSIAVSALQMVRMNKGNQLSSQSMLSDCRLTSFEIVQSFRLCVDIDRHARVPQIRETRNPRSPTSRTAVIEEQGKGIGMCFCIAKVVLNQFSRCLFTGPAVRAEKS